jgi:hypothetical protein
MKNKGRPKSPFVGCRSNGYAALSHIDVSNALLINGMFMPKLALAEAAAAAAFDAFFVVTTPASLLALLVGATSAARSHDPISWERATEKSRNI